MILRLNEEEMREAMEAYVEKMFAAFAEYKIVTCRVEAEGEDGEPVEVETWAYVMEIDPKGNKE